MTDLPFTPDAVRELGGPTWLAERRAAAAEALGDLALPTEDEEIWRYSRIEELDPSAYALTSDGSGAARGAPAGIPEEIRPIVDAVGERAGLVVTRNGRVVHTEVEETLAAKGVGVGDLSESEAGREHLGEVAAESPDWFTQLNDALLVGGALVTVPDGVVVERPILMFHWIDAPGVAVAPRVFVEAGEASEVTVLEHRSSPDVGFLSAGVSEVRAADASVVRYLGVQAHGHDAWEVALQRGEVGREARLTSGSIALGGDYARLRSESFVTGEGGTADLLAVYFADGEQMLDFRTLQDHEAPHSASDLLFKGAVEHAAHSVYSGLIRLRKGAQKASAHQSNRTMKLSPRSHAESVPNLEILANDVQCTHASAIGPIDDEQLYYLESRGVPPEVAERIVVFGFFEDVFERLPVGSVADPLRDAVREKFERRDREDAAAARERREELEAQGARATREAQPTQATQTTQANGGGG